MNAAIKRGLTRSTFLKVIIVKAEPGITRERNNFVGIAGRKGMKKLSGSLRSELSAGVKESATLV